MITNSITADYDNSQTEYKDNTARKHVETASTAKYNNTTAITYRHSWLGLLELWEPACELDALGG